MRSGDTLLASGFLHEVLHKLVIEPGRRNYDCKKQYI